MNNTLLPGAGYSEKKKIPVYHFILLFLFDWLRTIFGYGKVYGISSVVSRRTSGLSVNFTLIYLRFPAIGPANVWIQCIKVVGTNPALYKKPSRIGN